MRTPIQKICACIAVVICISLTAGENCDRGYSITQIGGDFYANGTSDIGWDSAGGNGITCRSWSFSGGQINWFKHQFDSAYCMGGVGKTYQHNVSFQNRYRVAELGVVNVAYDYAWDANPLKYDGSTLWARLALDIWTNDGAYATNVTGSDHQNEIMINLYPFAGASDDYVGQYLVPGTGGRTYKLYKDVRSTDLTSWTLEPVGFNSLWSGSGTIDVGQVLRWMRDTHGLDNEYVHEMKLTTELTAGGGTGTWALNTASLDDLTDVADYEDKIVALDVPSQVAQGAEESVIVDYSASTERDIVLWFRLDHQPYTTYHLSETRTTVSAGTGTLDLRPIIKANTPVANDDYQVVCFITEVGKKWNERKHYRVVSDIDCLAGGGSDEILMLNVPSQVQPASTQTYTVTYSATQDRDIVLWFRLDHGSYTHYSDGIRMPVSAGSGTLNLSGVIHANTPIANDDYQVVCFITKTGKSWADRFDYVAISNIDCVAGGDKIYAIEGPASVTPGSSPTYLVNYSATTSRDILLYFRLDHNPYTTYHQNAVRVTVPAGAGTDLDLSPFIKTNTPIANDDYQVLVYITEVGKGWSNQKHYRTINNIDCLNP